ncbi:DedA family protein [Caulobacter sp. NIBR2454]|uniref:DedA family protein n=1 Tax=Caulobacter sp. NIBR2454 TaxID=3015996 RepID=UPI0022B62B4F|nr:DedA family protein [Caulobacter sp. NIBR2454]
MDAFTHAASGFIAQHSAWAGLALGLLTFGESMLLIGAFLPATVLLFVAGGLIAGGVLDPVPVIAFTVAGAIIGDAVSYSLGRALGEPALNHPWLARHKTVVEQARRATVRHGVITLFAGRFAGPLRAFVPVLTGVAGMPPVRFHLANAASAVVWVAAFLAPGYLAGRGISLSGMTGTSALLALGALVAAALVTIAFIARPQAADRAAQPCG